MRRTVLMLVVAMAVAGCNHGGFETRARQEAEKITKSMPDVVSKALDQKTTPEQVQHAQEALRAAHEYLGEANGKLDAVTVNAIMAFQRSKGLADDGVLNDKTERALHDALAKK